MFTKTSGIDQYSAFLCRRNGNNSNLTFGFVLPQSPFFCPLTFPTARRFYG